MLQSLSKNMPSALLIHIVHIYAAKCSTIEAYTCWFERLKIIYSCTLFLLFNGAAVDRVAVDQFVPVAQ